MSSAQDLSDRDLLDAIARAVHDERRATIEAARYKTKREVEHQIACLAPRPDVRPLVRKVPETSTIPEPVAASLPAALPNQPTRVEQPPRPVVAPIAESRYLIKVAVSAETHAKLRRAQDLMRHQNPSGDPAAILDRALTLLVDHLERTKVARTPRPRQNPQRSRRQDSRHVPAEVKRAVWARDQGRCAFQGPHGRCRETGQLEFHHLIAFADGGPTTAGNLALRCRAHNSYESEQRFGPWDGRLDGSWQPQ